MVVLILKFIESGELPFELSPTDEAPTEPINFFGNQMQPKCVFEDIMRRSKKSPENTLDYLTEKPQDYMWGLGTLIAELRTGTNLFDKKEGQENIRELLSFLGDAPSDYESRCCTLDVYEGLKETGIAKVNLEEKLLVKSQFKDTKITDEENNDEQDFFDFISRILTWDCESRLTPSEAYNHQWLRSLREKSTN